MLRRLLASLQKTIVLTASPERFEFASNRGVTSLDTAVRVAADGRIVGFGASAVRDEGKVLQLFNPPASTVDERALQALCRNGLASALGPWGLRPRVVVRGARRVPVSREILARVLRAAGAAAVEFAD